MSILELMIKRRSIRSFSKKMITEQDLEAMIEAIRWAPSAGNLQSRKFFFIRNQQKKEELVAAALGQSFIAQAPMVIVACLDRRIFVRYGDRGINLYAIQDVAAGIMNLMLVAQERGLGTCWVGAFNEFEVHEILDMPDFLRPVAIIPVGYPARMVEGAPKRMPREETVVFVG